MENIREERTGQRLGLYSAFSQVLFGFVKQIQERLSCYFVQTPTAGDKNTWLCLHCSRYDLAENMSCHLKRI